MVAHDLRCSAAARPPSGGAEVDDAVETFRREGLEAAWRKFMVNAGFGDGDDGGLTPPREEPSEQELADGARFFAHELRGTTRYLPNVPALTAGPTRVVVGIGVASGGLLPYRTSTALAALLGTAPVEFPGDHGGFLDQPEDFAEVLRKVLRGERLFDARSGRPRLEEPPRLHPPWLAPGVRALCAGRRRRGAGPRGPIGHEVAGQAGDEGGEAPRARPTTSRRAAPPGARGARPRAARRPARRAPRRRRRRYGPRTTRWRAGAPAGRERVGRDAHLGGQPCRGHRPPALGHTGQGPHQVGGERHLGAGRQPLDDALAGLAPGGHAERARDLAKGVAVAGRSEALPDPAPPATVPAAGPRAAGG